MSTPEPLSEQDLARIRVLRRIAIAVGVVVALLCTGAVVLGYYFYTYDRPAKELFLEPDPNWDPSQSER